MSAGRRILVTGANGQLGEELRSVASAEWLFTDVEELDICSKAAVRDFIVANNVGTIVNCAAYTNVDMAEEEPEVAERINGDAVAMLAELSKECDVRLIHISTDYLFGGEVFTAPIDEDTEPKPLGVYGRTKLMGERAVIESGCSYVILRTAWLYSTYGTNFVKTIMRLSSEREELRVVNDQIGTPTYARDLALVIRDICEECVDVEGIYNYTNEGAISWYDFACAIVEIAGHNCRVVPCTTAEYGAKAARPAYSVLDKQKIRGVIHRDIPAWRASLEECIKRMTQL